MRIECFGKYIELHAVKSHVLEKSSLVIDAHNLLYNAYQRSRLPYLFGCEGNRFADFLRKSLGKFKRANLECYFVFKGVPEELDKIIKNEKKGAKTLKSCDNVFNPQQMTGQVNYSLSPLFARDICKEIIREMGFTYIVCEFDSRKDCIALAQKLQCPILSYDMNFCFSGVPYIPSSTLQFNETEERFECKIYTLDYFLEKHSIDEEKLAIFAAINDQLIFPADHFIKLVWSMKMRYSKLRRYQSLFEWLSRVSYKKAMDEVLRFTEPEDVKILLEAERNIYNTIRRSETGSVATEFLKKNIKFKKNDERWFAKGVAGEHIAIPYVNLYRSIVYGSRVLVKQEDDAVELSMDIIIYAYNLLTNYNNDGFQLQSKIDDNTKHVANISSVRKPRYEAKKCVFENGWHDIKSLRLFEHFITESLGEFDFKGLNALPSDVVMLIVALIYFAKKKGPQEVANEVYSVILSYVMLGVVFEKYDKNAVVDIDEEDRQDLGLGTTDLDTNSNIESNTAVESNLDDHATINDCNNSTVTESKENNHTGSTDMEKQSEINKSKELMVDETTEIDTATIKDSNCSIKYKSEVEKTHESNVKVNEIASASDDDNKSTLRESEIDSKTTKDSQGTDAIAVTTDKNNLTTDDCNIAAAQLKKFFDVEKKDEFYIFSRRRIYPLVQYQHCLEHLNYLNLLCGKPYDPTIYHKTYNGTFVYRILHKLKKEEIGGLDYIKYKLQKAPTVLSFILGLVQVYESILNIKE